MPRQKLKGVKGVSNPAIGLAHAKRTPRIPDSVKAARRARKEAFASRMRSNPTESERLLALGLSLHPLIGGRGIVFQPQCVIRGFIADFYCIRLAVVIEVDGKSHIGRERLDSLRDKILGKSGIQTLRYSAQRVIKDPTSVINEIVAAIDNRLDQY